MSAEACKVLAASSAFPLPEPCESVGVGSSAFFMPWICSSPFVRLFVCCAGAANAQPDFGPMVKPKIDGDGGMGAAGCDWLMGRLGD